MSFLSSNTHHLLKLKKELLCLPNLSFSLDKKEYCTDSNEIHAKTHGFHSVEAVIGISVLDTPSAEQQKKFISHAQEVYSRKVPLSFIEGGFSNIHKAPVRALSIKAPIFNSRGESIGIQGVSLVVEDICINTLFQQFVRVAELLEFKFSSSSILQTMTQLIELNSAQQQWQKKTNLFDYGKVSFNLREAQCLHYFLNHYSAQKTGEKLNISSKTVEHYLASIKRKLDCKDVSKICNIAIDYGFIDLMFMKF